MAYGDYITEAKHDDRSRSCAPYGRFGAFFLEPINAYYVRMFIWQEITPSTPAPQLSLGTENTL